jgi:hypothetical protein
MAWHDGTRELVFEPLEFLERLAAMAPRQETNSLICHGLRAARARGRARGRVRPVRARAHNLGGANGLPLTSLGCPHCGAGCG